MDEVAARLQALVDAGDDGRSPSPAPPSPAPPSPAPTIPLPSPDSRRRDAIESELECYTTLVEDGCQPWYPITELEQVVSSPASYSARFWIWQSNPTESDIFSKQLLHWRQFRQWQCSRRSERSISECQSISTEQLGRSAPARGFQLKQNPSAQDQWTTWVEYISYVASEFNRYRKGTLSSKPRREKLWKELQDSGILRHGEDEASLLKGYSQQALEREDAERVLVSLSGMEPRAKQKGSGRRLLDAKKALEHVERRNERITEYIDATKELRRDEEETTRFGAILRWSKEQLSTIERELSASKPAGKQNNSRGRAGGVKRRREASTAAEQANGGEAQIETPSRRGKASTKRQRTSPMDAAVRDRKDNGQVTPSKRRNQGPARQKPESSAIAAPRRSARIAKLGASKATPRR